jgi:hypothetical protein
MSERRHAILGMPMENRVRSFGYNAFAHALEQGDGLMSTTERFAIIAARTAASMSGEPG